MRITNIPKPRTSVARFRPHSVKPSPLIFRSEKPQVFTQPLQPVTAQARANHLIETSTRSLERVASMIGQISFLSTLGFAATFVTSLPVFFNNTIAGFASLAGAAVSFTIFGFAYDAQLQSALLRKDQTTNATATALAWNKLHTIINSTSKIISTCSRLWKASLVSMGLPLTMNYLFVDQNWNFYSAVSAGLTVGFFAGDRLFRAVQRKLKRIDGNTQSDRVQKLPDQGFGLLPLGLVRAAAFLLSSGSTNTVWSKIKKGLLTVFVNEKRWISTPLLIGTICAIPFASTAGVTLGAFALSALCLGEYAYRVAFKNQTGFIRHFAFGTPLLVGAALMGLGYSSASTALFFPVVAAGLFLSSVFAMFSSKDSDQVFPRIAFCALGMYIPITLAHLPLLHALSNGPAWTLGIMLVTASGDIFAQLSGSAFGKTKLSDTRWFKNLGQISPKKTIQGLLGQSIGVCFTAYAYVKLALPAGAAGLTDIVAMGLIAGIIGPLGDIMESAVKRHFHVKDSGGFGPATLNEKGDTIHKYSTLPGHGGWMDRTDGHIWTLTAMYYYLSFLKPLLFV